MSPKPKIIAKIGNQRGSKGTQGVRAYNEQLRQAVIGGINDARSRSGSYRTSALNRVALNVKRAMDREILKIMPFIMRVMFNISSGSNANTSTFVSGRQFTDRSGDFDVSIGLPFLQASKFSFETQNAKGLDFTLFSSYRDLVWRNLQTYRDKKKRGAGDKFFVDSGDLKSSIGNKITPARMLATLGKTRAEIIPHKTKTNRNEIDELIGTIKVTVAPGITQALLPALATGQSKFDAPNVDWTKADRSMRFESKLGLGAEEKRKLSGFGMFRNRSKQMVDVNSEYFRPLFQPVVQFWLFHRVPRALTSAFGQSIVKRNVGGRG